MSEREHKPYHERRVDQQMLDALLRIEERLNRHWGTPEVPEQDEEPQLSMSQFANKEDLEAAKKSQQRGKRK